MKILIVCDSFYPQRNAPANRFLTLISNWSKDHKIYLITKNTTISDIKMISKYIKKDNFEIFSNNYSFKSHKIIFKFINLIIFFLFSFSLFFKLRNKNVDVVISSTPSLVTLPIGFFISLYKKSKFIIEIRDIWSDSLKDLNIIKSNIIYKFIKNFEIFFYSKAKLLVSVSNNIKNRIKLNKRHVVFTNFASIDLIDNQNLYTRNSITKINKSKILILYLGTLGLSHEFDLLFNIIKINNSIELNIVGEGTQKKNLAKIIKNENISNIILNGYSNSHKILSQFYNKSNYCLIILKNIDIFSTVIPSKLFECAFLKKIIIYYGPKNEASELIDKYKIGFTSHSIDDLKKIINNLNNIEIDYYDYNRNFDKFNNDYLPNDIAIKYLNEIIIR